MINFQDLQNDFPILQRKVHGKKLVFLDSGASSQKPLQVINAIQDVYQNHYANIHRGIYALSAEATELYDDARKKVAAFIHAKSWREIVFTRNTTESINLVTYSWGRQNLKAGDAILISEMEHHANLIPWQQLSAQTGAELRYLPIDRNGYLVLDDLDQLLNEQVKILSITGMSNVLGTIPPLEILIHKAHQVGALVLVDGAQSVPHMPTDVQALDCDFLAFSSHKMLGPSGIGVLYGKREHLESMPPFMTGGDMINKVDFYHSEWADIPQKFEAGTPAIAEAVGLGAAIDYLQALDMKDVREHEKELVTYALDKLSLEEGIKLIGPLDVNVRGAAISFNLGNIHPHDLSSILDSEGIAIRAGHHCAMPLHRKLNISASARASFYIYNTTEDIDELIIALDKARTLFS